MLLYISGNALPRREPREFDAQRGRDHAFGPADVQLADVRLDVRLIVYRITASHLYAPAGFAVKWKLGAELFHCDGAKSTPKAEEQDDRRHPRTGNR